MTPSTPQPRRRTVARHGQLRSPRPVSQLFTILAVAVASVLVAVVGVVGFTVYSFTTDYVSNAVALPGEDSVPPDIGAIQGGYNLLIVGTDECLPDFAAMFPGRCSGADDGSINNDVDIVVHISDNPRRVTVISFPRDLMLPIPSCTRDDGTKTSAMSKQPLNSTYAVAGLGCVAQTITSLTGMQIQGAAKITWGGVIQITDAIGGVDVCVSGRIYDPTNTGLDLGPGMHTLVGLQALEFLRTRHGVGDGSDLGRISNQQQYMSRLAQKLISAGTLSDPTTLLRLASIAVKNITPSKSLTNPITLVQLATAMKDVPYSDIVFVQYPTLTDPSNPNKVVPNTSAASALFTALENNEALQLTGKVGQNGGVIEVTPSATPTPTPSSSASSTPSTSTTPNPTATLPSSISGQTAAQETCSDGNLKK